MPRQAQLYFALLNPSLLRGGGDCGGVGAACREAAQCSVAAMKSRWLLFCTCTLMTVLGATLGVTHPAYCLQRLVQGQCYGVLAQNRSQRASGAAHLVVDVARCELTTGLHTLAPCWVPGAGKEVWPCDLAKAPCKKAAAPWGTLVAIDEAHVRQARHLILAGDKIGAAAQVPRKGGGREGAAALDVALHHVEVALDWVTGHPLLGSI